MRPTFAERSALFQRLAAYLQAHKTASGRIASLELGKPITEAEAEKCAWNCEYYAEHAQRFLADEKVQISATRSYVAFQPPGVILSLMPWKFPYWQVFPFAAPALMAGNTPMLKHASHVSRCVLEIGRIFCACGFSEGVFRTLVPGTETGRLIADPRASQEVRGRVGGPMPYCAS